MHLLSLSVSLIIVGILAATFLSASASPCLNPISLNINLGCKLHRQIHEKIQIEAPHNQQERIRKIYDPYIFVFETDYEDFIIDLFSELPTSCLFFKVSGKLVLYAYVDREQVKSIDLHVPDISKMHIPLLIRNLIKKGIIKSKERAAVAYHWRKDI